MLPHHNHVAYTSQARTSCEVKLYKKGMPFHKVQRVVQNILMLAQTDDGTSFFMKRKNGAFNRSYTLLGRLYRCTIHAYHRQMEY